MLMLVVSFFAFYTIYWIVRCIHFIGAMRKLDTRRDSIIAVGQLGNSVLSFNVVSNSMLLRS